MKYFIIILILTSIPTANIALKAGNDNKHATNDATASDSPLSDKATPGVMKIKRIAHGDLNLSIPEDQATLLTRVQSVVQLVCGPRGYSASEKLDIAQCEMDATARAMPKVENLILRARE